MCAHCLAACMLVRQFGEKKIKITVINGTDFQVTTVLGWFCDIWGTGMRTAFKDRLLTLIFSDAQMTLLSPFLLISERCCLKVHISRVFTECK